MKQKLALLFAALLLLGLLSGCGSNTAKPTQAKATAAAPSAKETAVPAATSPAETTASLPADGRSDSGSEASETPSGGSAAINAVIDPALTGSWRLQGMDPGTEYGWDFYADGSGRMLGGGMEIPIDYYIAAKEAYTEYPEDGLLLTVVFGEMKEVIGDSVTTMQMDPMEYGYSVSGDVLRITYSRDIANNYMDFERTEAVGPTESSAPDGNISVAGLSLQAGKAYRVRLEPDPACETKFAPFYVTLEFSTANACSLSCEAGSVKLGRQTNSVYFGLYSMDDDPDAQLIIDGRGYADCGDADFRLSVSYLNQGPKALCVFKDIEQAAPALAEEPEQPKEKEQLSFRAGKTTVRTGVLYTVHVSPAESCDKKFDAFDLPVKFLTELSAMLVTAQKKNVSEVYPASIYREDNGWIEFSGSRDKFWGTLEAGKSSTELKLSVVGLEGNLCKLFNVTSLKKEEPVPLPKPAPTAVLPIGDYDTEIYYYYGLLSDKERSVYTQILTAMEAVEKEISLVSPVSNEDFHRILNYVMLDQPQLFWANCSYFPSYSGGKVAKVQLSYNDLAKNLKQEKKKVDKAVSTVLSAVKKKSKAEAERYVHDYLIKHIKYNYNSYDQNIYSAFVTGETVCAGYTRAFQYIMQQLGIPCCYCRGVAKSSDGSTGRHAWNLIKLNKKWYNVDVTWDDQYHEEHRGWDYSCITYQFYNVTDSFMSVEHSRHEEGDLLPACSSTAASFDKLYGHSWQEEVAKSAGIPAVSSLKSYYKQCYNRLMAVGVGDSSFGFITVGEDVRQQIWDQFGTKGFDEGCFKPFIKDKGLKGSYYYSCRIPRCSYIGSRQCCMYVWLEQSVTKK